MNKIKEKGIEKHLLLGSTILQCFLFCLAVLLVFPFTVSAQDKEKEKKKPLTRILFVFDASQSMYGRWQSGTKMEVAQNLMSDLLDSLARVENLELALRVYGHQSQFPPQDCKDTKLEVPFSHGTIPRIKAKIKSLTPKGTTPIAYSLEKSGDDFPVCMDCRNIIILITDGIEECAGDPCAVSAALQKKGIVLKPFVIGVGLGIEIKKQFECVGNYYDATNETIFKNVLNVVISQALNSTTAQVNLLDNFGKPTETNVNMTFYDIFSGKIKYNFIHTLNHRGTPDTLSIDPLPTYKVVAHTIPPVWKDSVKLTPGKHTIIPIDAPQGYLQLKVDGKSDYRTLQYIVRKAGEMQTLNIQDFMETEKYIVGNYDLEVLCLPRIFIKDVDISQSHTTNVTIPQPGIANILKKTQGNGCIMLEDKNELTLVYNLKEFNVQENILLQPGKYRVVFRPKNSRESKYTIENSFKIESGSSITITLY